MAEFFSTKHIAKNMREYIKAESRRLRLSGVRAKVIVVYTGKGKDLPFYSAFSWADITIVKKYVRSITLAKEIIQSAAADNSVHGITSVGDDSDIKNIRMLSDMVPAEKDVLCKSAYTVASFLRGESHAHIPCRADAVLRMLRYSCVDIKDKTAVVLGTGNEARALCFLLMNSGVCVTLSSFADERAKVLCRNADMLFSFLKRKNAVNSDFVNEKQTIVDLSGSVDIHSVEPYVNAIYTSDENSFSELCSYIAADHVLKSARLSLIRLKSLQG